MTENVFAQARELAQAQRTMVLATADMQAWVAPVYYLYWGGKFYFFSNPESQHIQAAKANPKCAAAIYRDSDHWREIEGLQMEGRVAQVTDGPEANQVFGAYVAKFPTVRELLAEPLFDLARFLRVFRAEMYVFVANRVFYVNNKEGFASRRDITAELSKLP